MIENERQARKRLQQRHSHSSLVVSVLWSFHVNQLMPSTLPDHRDNVIAATHANICIFFTKYQYLIFLYIPTKLVFWSQKPRLSYDNP